MIADYKKILEERRQRECIGKIQYTSMQAAARARKRMESRFNNQVFREYGCDFCGRFHIGHARYQQEHFNKGKNTNEKVT